MEAGRGLLSAPPSISRTHLRNPQYPSSVLVLHGQASRAIISTPTSAVRHFPTSLLTQDQHNNYNNSYAIQEEKMDQALLHLQNVKDGSLSSEEREKHHFDLYLKNMERGLLCHPGLWYSFLRTYNLENPSVMWAAELINEKYAGAVAVPILAEENNISTMSPEDVLALAKQALSASQDAALLAKKAHIFIEELAEKTSVPSVDPSICTNGSKVEREKAVSSNCHSKRHSKKRKVFTKTNDIPCGTSISMVADKVRRTEKIFDNDPLRLFLSGPETKQLLSITEENDLFAQIQVLMGLEAVKEKLNVQFGREPTLTEWARAIGTSCQDLQGCISSGIRGRHRVIYANFRLVIHVAKQYEGKGLNIQDLLQEGSTGLMKSLGKFKQKIGCRFSTYAYWWIRQSIRKAIFQHSRTIRLPENVFAELKRIRDAKRLCIQEGSAPTNEEVAKRAGMHVSKLENLLKISRNPISIQSHTWVDQDITFQEITADPEIEIPKLAVEKQMMRRHVHSLLGVLSPRERKLIRLRFGIKCNEPKSLQQIGDMFGISKERVRQLENKALKKMRACSSNQGLGAYSELLM